MQITQAKKIFPKRRLSSLRSNRCTFSVAETLIKITYCPKQNKPSPLQPNKLHVAHLKISRNK
jgi:hypothetical protein